MAESVKQSQYFKKAHYQRYAQASTANTSAPKVAIGNQRVATQTSVTQAQTKTGISRYEVGLAITVVCIMMILIATNLMLQSNNQSLKRSVDSIADQTVELHKQTDSMMNQITKQYDYQAIKEAAEKAGMQVQKANVKDLSQP